MENTQQQKYDCIWSSSEKASEGDKAYNMPDSGTTEQKGTIKHKTINFMLMASDEKIFEWVSCIKKLVVDKAGKIRFMRERYKKINFGPV